MLCRPRHNLDLLFYHLKQRCYVVVELKTTPFKPAYAGSRDNHYVLIMALIGGI